MDLLPYFTCCFSWCFIKYIIYEKQKVYGLGTLALKTNGGLYLGYTLLLTWVSHLSQLSASPLYNNTFCYETYTQNTFYFKKLLPNSVPEPLMILDFLPMIISYNKHTYRSQNSKSFALMYFKFLFKCSKCLL